MLKACRPLPAWARWEVGNIVSCSDQSACPSGQKSKRTREEKEKQEGAALASPPPVAPSSGSLPSQPCKAPPLEPHPTPTHPSLCSSTMGFTRLQTGTSQGQHRPKTLGVLAKCETVGLGILGMVFSSPDPPSTFLSEHGQVMQLPEPQCHVWAMESVLFSMFPERWGEAPFSPKPLSACGVWWVQVLPWGTRPFCLPSQSA